MLLPTANAFAQVLAAHAQILRKRQPAGSSSKHDSQPASQNPALAGHGGMVTEEEALEAAATLLATALATLPLGPFAASEAAAASASSAHATAPAALPTTPLMVPTAALHTQSASTQAAATAAAAVASPAASVVRKPPQEGAAWPVKSASSSTRPNAQPQMWSRRDHVHDAAATTAASPITPLHLSVNDLSVQWLALQIFDANYRHLGSSSASSSNNVPAFTHLVTEQQTLQGFTAEEPFVDEYGTAFLKWREVVEVRNGVVGWCVCLCVRTCICVGVGVGVGVCLSMCVCACACACACLYGVCVCVCVCVRAGGCVCVGTSFLCSMSVSEIPAPHLELSEQALKPSICCCHRVNMSSYMGCHVRIWNFYVVMYEQDASFCLHVISTSQF